MKRIRVPEGMLKAAKEAMRRCPVVIDVDQGCDGGILTVLEASLLWLSEHPQVPTDEQINELWEHWAVPLDSSAKGLGVDGPSRNQIRDTCVEWQRRCFVQEEPEIPEEIKDVVDELFRNGCGDEAQRLVLTSADGRDLGGWCKQAIIDRLVRSLRKGEQK